MIRTLILATAFLATAGAGAGEPPEQDPAGLWAFKTDIRDKGCSITGRMSIEPAREGETGRMCRFLSSETCGEDDPQSSDMEQSCRIIFQGAYLTIRSQVVRSLSPDVPAELYLPDHFTVRPVAPGRMEGTWYDRNYADAVAFWRVTDTPVS